MDSHKYKYTGDQEICFWHYPYRLKKNDIIHMGYDHANSFWTIIEIDKYNKQMTGHRISNVTMGKMEPFLEMI